MHGEADRPVPVGRRGHWWAAVRARGAALAAEALMLYALLLAYKLVRASVRGNVDQAYDNAHAVMDAERQLGLFVEPTLQQLVVGERWLVRAMNRYYVNVHLIGTALVLLALWVLVPVAYAQARRVLMVLTGSALVVHVLYPLAPPRMFPWLGFVDTGRLIGPSPYSNGALRSIANQYAAMPSLHFGWALLLAWAVLRATRGRGIWRWAIVAHPAATAAVVVLTANHYWLDLFVAAVLFVMAVAVEPLVARHTANALRALRRTGPAPSPSPLGGAALVAAGGPTTRATAGRLAAGGSRSTSSNPSPPTGSAP